MRNRKVGIEAVFADVEKEIKPKKATRRMKRLLKSIDIHKPALPLE